MRVGVLSSSVGTNFDAICEAGIPVDVLVVDRRCGAEEVAARHGVTVERVERNDFGPNFDRVEYTERVVEVLQRHDVDLVVMAGFMTVFEEPMFKAFDGRILNTHPALLPAFKGAHAVRDAIDAGVKITGCTVHVATLELDSGPILAQEAVPVEPGDDEATLHERIKAAERRLYPATIRRILELGAVLP